MLVIPAGLQNLARIARDSCSTRGNSDSGPNHLEDLFDTSGTGTRSQVTRDIRSIPEDMGDGLEWPGTAVRHRGYWDSGPSHLGGWSTTQELIAGCESARKAG